MTKTFKFDGYLITCDEDIRAEEFSNEWYYGITFYVGGGKYELIHNYALGSRILSSPKEGWSTDIPFKPATFHLLPEGITAEE
jgi:hypothetical protein